MIEVSLSETGNPRRFVQGVSTRGDAEPMYISECYRCLGILIVFTRKPEIRVLTSQYLTAGYHIPPSHKKYARDVRRKFFRELKYIRRYYDAKLIGICGGKVNTPINQRFYKILRGQFISPLQHLFPEATFFESKPGQETEYSTLYMDEEFSLIVEQF